MACRRSAVRSRSGPPLSRKEARRRRAFLFSGERARLTSAGARAIIIPIGISMPRTADPDSPTKRKLLSAAEKLILKKGFTATTVDDICGVAGLTKGSFFHYFENKDELGKAVLAHSMENRRRMLESAPYVKL